MGPGHQQLRHTFRVRAGRPARATYFRPPGLSKRRTEQKLRSALSKLDRGRLLFDTCTQCNHSFSCKLKVVTLLRTHENNCFLEVYLKPHNNCLYTKITFKKNQRKNRDGKYFITPTATFRSHSFLMSLLVAFHGENRNEVSNLIFATLQDAL